MNFLTQSKGNSVDNMQKLQFNLLSTSPPQSNEVNKNILTLPSNNNFRINRSENVNNDTKSVYFSGMYLVDQACNDESQNLETAFNPVRISNNNASQIDTCSETVSNSTSQFPNTNPAFRDANTWKAQQCGVPGGDAAGGQSMTELLNSDMTDTDHNNNMHDDGNQQIDIKQNLVANQVNTNFRLNLSES